MSAKLESELAKVNQELASLKAEYEDFVYIVSHDLSAPLRQIQSFSEIIVNKHGDCFDDKTNRHFELINNGSTQITIMIEALKSYSRLNTRTKPFELLDCNKSVAQALENLSALITDTKASITCDILPEIIGDEAQITFLFQHLIKNSLTYQSTGNKPVISISFTQDNDDWKFCITDNGIGISDNLTKKIFKVLRRGVSSKKYPGLGMGLAFVTKILQKHQGDISVATEIEHGATFTFKIAKDLPHE